jgi:hypothetical protein
VGSRCAASRFSRSVGEFELGAAPRLSSTQVSNLAVQVPSSDLRLTVRCGPDAPKDSPSSLKVKCFCSWLQVALPAVARGQGSPQHSFVLRRF